MTFEELELGRNPFITRIHEPGDNSLIIDVRGGIVEEISDAERQQRMDAAPTPAERLLASANAVSMDESIIYRIAFEEYIAYQVVNESYDAAPEGPVYQDKKCRVFTESLFLEYVRTAAIMAFAECFSDGRQPLHYGIWSQNHIVGVASCHAPHISILRTGQEFRSG